MGELVTALMVWISAFTGLPVPEEQPRIIQADRCAIQQMFHQDGTFECLPDDQPHVMAFYAGDVMYLPDTWSAKRIYDVSMLLHELVHHMQFSAGVDPRKSKCPGMEIEKPAYDAQMAFLKAAGLDPLPVMGLNELNLFFITQCETSY